MEWSELERLAELEAAWREAVHGSTLLHCDVRADNLLVTKKGVVFVDWPHACVGTPVFDLVAWAPSVVSRVARPRDLLALSDPGPFSTATRWRPGRRLQRLPRPPLTPTAPTGLPTLRTFQGAQGGVAVAWLRRLTGW